MWAAGSSNRRIQEYERLFVSQGISDSLNHAINDCKLERLNSHYLDYILRQTFAWKSQRLKNEEKAMKRVAKTKESKEVEGTAREVPTLGAPPHKIRVGKQSRAGESSSDDVSTEDPMTETSEDSDIGDKNNALKKKRYLIRSPVRQQVCKDGCLARHTNGDTPR